MEKSLTQEQSQRVWEVLRAGAAVETMQTAEELHDFMQNYNWDNGVATVEKVINHPKCDKGTALMCYWLASPAYWLRFDDVSKVSEYMREDYLFVKMLERKYVNGEFTRSEIAFDPHSDDGTDWIADSERERKAILPNKIPQQMFEPVEGIGLKRGSYPG